MKNLVRTCSFQMAAILIIFLCPSSANMVKLRTFIYYDFFIIEIHILHFLNSYGQYALRYMYKYYTEFFEFDIFMCQIFC